MFLLRCVIIALILSAAVHITKADAGQMPRPVPLTVVHDQCPDGWRACADTDRSTIYVGRSPSRFTVSHETGHVFFVQEQVGPGSRIERLLHAGVWGTRARPCQLACEIGADAYAACDIGLTPARGTWTLGYGYSPTVRQHARICNEIRWLRYARYSRQPGATESSTSPNGCAVTMTPPSRIHSTALAGGNGLGAC